MPIRRMTDVADIESMMNIVRQHNKFQGLSKESIFVDIGNPKWTYDNIFKTMLENTINLDFYYHFGNFSDSGELLSFITFRFWTDTDINQECWTANSMFKNKNTPSTYSYGQKYFPDEIVDVHNHGVAYAESMGIKIGYTLSPSAIPGHWNRIISVPGILHGPDRYHSELVEEIKGGTRSAHEKYRTHVARVPFSTNQQIYRYTKIE